MAVFQLFYYCPDSKHFGLFGLDSGQGVYCIQGVMRFVDTKFERKWRHALRIGKHLSKKDGLDFSMK